MKKVVLVLLIVLILVMTLNTASAMGPLPPTFSLLITNYKDVDSVTLVFTDADGNETKEVHEDAKDAEKTRVRLERIHNFRVDYMDIEYNTAENGSFVVVVKTVDNSTYVSETFDGDILYSYRDYVFDTEKRAFEDREIDSRLSDAMVGFILGLLLCVFYFAALIVKLIVGLIYKVKPIIGLLLFDVLLMMTSIVVIEVYYLYILSGISVFIVGIIIVCAVIEHFVMNKMCKYTSKEKRVSYVIVSNIFVAAGSFLIIGFIISIFGGA